MTAIAYAVTAAIIGGFASLALIVIMAIELYLREQRGANLVGLLGLCGGVLAFRKLCSS